MFSALSGMTPFQKVLFDFQRTIFSYLYMIGAVEFCTYHMDFLNVSGNMLHFHQAFPVFQIDETVNRNEKDYGTGEKEEQCECNCEPEFQR